MMSLLLPIDRPIMNISFGYSHHTRNKPLSLSTRSSDLAGFPCKPNSSNIKLRLAGRLTKCAAEGDDEEKNPIVLPGGLEAKLMPKHVAVIMDGNRRWARNRGLPVQLGHKAGAKAMKQLAMNCMKYGAKVLSVFAFSTENWARPKEEVDYLMYLFGETFVSDVEELIQNENMQVTYLGNRRWLPESLQTKISASEEHAKNNKGMHLLVAMNYSGQYDIIEATKKIAAKVKHGVFQVEDIERTLFEQHLETNRIEFPNPDLMIRTSGELRVSNFMLWQLAYSEMFFTNKMFPDFEETDLVEALIAFQRRQRRFGAHKY